MHGVSAYSMNFSLNQFVMHSSRLMNNLVYADRDGFMTYKHLILMWSGFIVAAAIARRKYLWFFLALALLGPVPVVFLPWRGFFVMYLPLAGWVLVIATLLKLTLDWLINFFGMQHWRYTAQAAKISLFLVLGLAITQIRRLDANPYLIPHDPSWQAIRQMRDDILSLNAPVPKGARLLFRHDRFPADAWGPLMMSQLLYRDRALSVDRPTMMKVPPDEASYDRVFDYVNGKLTVVRSRDAGSAIIPDRLEFPR